MKFCPKCGSIMMPKMAGKKTVLACSCGHSETAENVSFTEKSRHTDKKIEVIEKEPTINPIVDADCPKCHHSLAEHWEVQTRSADEPATRFFKCQKCGHTRREYK